MEIFRQPSRVGMSVKVYVVVAPTNDGLRIIASKLTRDAAQAVAARHVGAYVQKTIADKE